MRSHSPLAAGILLAPMLLGAQSPLRQQPAIVQVPGVPNRPNLVTVVPFAWKPDEDSVEQTRVVIQAEADGRRGNFVLDLGNPNVDLNRAFLQPSPRGGVDTVTDIQRQGDGDATVHITLRIGTLLDTINYYWWHKDWPTPPAPPGTNANLIKDIPAGDEFTPLLGNIGIPALESFETIIDYTHQRVVLIRLDKAGHRMVNVPAYTPAWSAPLIEVRPRGDTTDSHLGTWWGVQALVGGVPDSLFFDTGAQINGLEEATVQRLGSHLRSEENAATLDSLVIAGRSFGPIPISFRYPPPRSVLGYPFLSRLGAVGFNHRTHQFILYRGIPNRPDLVTVVPFYWKPNETAEEQTKVVVPAEVDGHHGIFIVDLGAPPFYLNRTFLQPNLRGGVDTVTDTARMRDTVGERPRTWDKVRVTVRMGTVLDTVDDHLVTSLLNGANPHRYNAFLNHYWGNFGWNFAPRLGNLGLSVFEPFETIIDYTHRRLVLIRLDSAGHRLVDVPEYTPRWSTPLRNVDLWGDGQQYWGINVRPDESLDTLDVHQNTILRVLDTGAPDNEDQLLGYPFLRQLGVVGVNHRTHQFLLYQAAQARSDPSVTVTAFVDVAVLPMDRERVLTGQTVLVQGGRIIGLGAIDHVPVPAGALRIDGRGKFLIPGLADMHTHIAVDSVDAEHVLLLMLAHGVTTIRNMDYDPANARNEEQVLRFRARTAAGTLLSPRIYTAGPWGPRQYTDRKHPAEDPPPRLDSIAAYVAAYKAAGYDFIKIHEETRVIVDSVAGAAHRLGIPVLGHLPAANQYGYDYALHVGYRSIEHLGGYGPEDVGVPATTDPQILDTLPLPGLSAAATATQRAGVWNCPTQALMEWYWYNYHVADRQNGGGLPLRRRVIKALQDAGAGLLLGTDPEWESNNVLVTMLHRPNVSVQDELAALVRAGLTPYQALLTGTRNVAAYFGELTESGTVAMGKRADLVLLDENPLTDIQNTDRIAGVMLGGRWFRRTELDRRLAAFQNPPFFSTWQPPH